MGSISRFRIIRGVPAQGAGSQPGFQFNRFIPVRQIPTQKFTISSAAPTAVFASAFLPANSWALNKFLRFTIGYRLTCAAIGPGAPQSIVETIGGTGIAQTSLRSQGPTTPTLTTFSTVEVIRAYRDTTEGVFWREGETSQAYSPGSFAAGSIITHWFSSAFGPDFTQPVQFDLHMILPAAPYNFILQPLFVSCFVEQAVNLHGVLPP